MRTRMLYARDRIETSHRLVRLTMGVPTFTPGPESLQYSMHAFGAQFAEVRVDPDLGEIRVSRWSSAFGVGTVLNEKTARSQLMGGIIMGIWTSCLTT